MAYKTGERGQITNTFNEASTGHHSTKGRLGGTQTTTLDQEKNAKSLSTEGEKLHKAALKKLRGPEPSP